MFKIIDISGYIHTAYGTFIDNDGDVQFILCDGDGNFYKTNQSSGFYKLYIEDSDTKKDISKKDISEKLKEIKARWDNELSAIYGGELEVDYFEGNYYVCAYHDEPQVINDIKYDSWVEDLKEFECLGPDERIEWECFKLDIPICH